MRPQKIMDTDLLNGLMSVLRSKGYDGASLNELASSSGLKKASLYHRYPGGKKEIALAVLNHVDEWVDAHILKLLSNKNILPARRLKKTIDNIKLIYGNGTTACILKALSSKNGLELFGSELRGSMEKWIRGFTSLGLELGFTKKEANIKATEVLVMIQGSLVVSNIFENPKAFQQALQKIKVMYTKV